MAVALVDGRIGGQKVEVALAFNIGDPCARGALDDDIEWVVVVGAVLLFQCDEIQIDCYHAGLFSTSEPQVRPCRVNFVD